MQFLLAQINMSESIEYIEHQAIVRSVDPVKGTISVRIDDIEECGDCPAANLCGAKGESSNLVTIATPMASSLKPDDIIFVRGTETMHRKAIMYATVFPCIILVAIMVGIYLLTANQLAAALSGIGAMLLFFLILYLFRNKIAHEFTFSVVGPVEHPGEMK